MPHPWRPLSDPEFAALAPHIPQPTTGRPLPDLRARLDAQFWVAAHRGPWRKLPRRFGNAATVARHFRRWAHSGVWRRLLLAAAAPDAAPDLQALLEGLLALQHRAAALDGIEGHLLIRRLGLPYSGRAEARALCDPQLALRLSRWLARPENAWEGLHDDLTLWLQAVVHRLPEWPPRATV